MKPNEVNTEKPKNGGCLSAIIAIASIVLLGLSLAALF